jgi:hypothetical protein
MPLAVFMYYFILFASVIIMLEQWYKNIFVKPPPYVSTTLHLTIHDVS